LKEVQQPALGKKSDEEVKKAFEQELNEFKERT
jgi:hypothetical protein